MRFFITFGFGHNQPGNNGLVKSLSRHYTEVIADSREDAMRIMAKKRGFKWASCYKEAEKEGAIDSYGLTFIPFDEVKAQEGPNL